MPGAADVQAEQTSGAPTFDIKVDRQAAGRYGLSVEEVASTVAAALGGREAGLLFEGDRRFAVVVRLPDAQRDDIDTLGSIPVMLPSNGAGNARSIPLSEVALFNYTERLNPIRREHGTRMVVIQTNLRGRPGWTRSGLVVRRLSTLRCGGATARRTARRYRHLGIDPGHATIQRCRERAFHPAQRSGALHLHRGAQPDQPRER